MNLQTRNYILILFGIILLMLAVSCKKGENDPFLSCRFRKARLLGEWILTGGTIVTHSGTLTDSTVYNGSDYIKYLDSNILQGIHSHRLKFDKNGSYIEEIVTDNVTETIAGFWMFGDKNKEADLKSKETLILFIKSDSHYSNGITDITSYSGTDCPSYSIKLDKLRNKELALIYDGSIANQSSALKTGLLNFEKK